MSFLSSHSIYRLKFTFKQMSLEYRAFQLLSLTNQFVLFWQEAQALSSLVPFLDEHSVNLYAVVHEVLGTEEFKGFFSGEVFLDPEVSTILIVNKQFCHFFFFFGGGVLNQHQMNILLTFFVIYSHQKLSLNSLISNVEYCCSHCPCQRTSRHFKQAPS